MSAGTAKDTEPRQGRATTQGALPDQPSLLPGRPRAPLARTALWTVRIAWVGFWLFLTVLLLSPDPQALLGLERWAERLPDPKAAHVVCFAVLAIFAYASRLPVSRILVPAALAAYAVATEGLQSFVPPRTAAWSDVALDFSGLAIGALLWSAGAAAVLAARRRGEANRPATLEVKAMNDLQLQRFRIVTVEGLLSHDTFVISAERSPSARAGCLVVVNERDGGLVTVHRDRLVPVESGGPPILHHPSHTACLKCGRVEGIVEDHVTCPYHGNSPCGLLEARGARAQLAARPAAK